MIDIKKAINTFINYTNNFDTKNPKIDLKIKDSIRVMKISEEIARKKVLDKEQIELASLIGLLHDIGRFKQYTKYKTYTDHISIDHGDLGVEILFEENKIKDYVTEEKYYKIIEEAIKNHNKYILETKNLTNQEKLFCELIKDADKIDILYEAAEIFWKGEEERVQKSIITKEVEKNFLDKKLIENKIKETEADKIVGMISFIYDINFKESFEIIKERDYINKIINRFNFEEEKTKEKIEKIRNIAEQYLEEKIK